MARDVGEAMASQAPRLDLVRAMTPEGWDVAVHAGALHRADPEILVV